MKTTNMLLTVVLLGSSLALGGEPGMRRYDFWSKDIGETVNNAINAVFEARGWGKVRSLEVLRRQYFEYGGVFSHVKVTSVKGNVTYFDVGSVKACDNKKQPNRNCDGRAKEDTIRMREVDEEDFNAEAWGELVEGRK